MVRGTPARNMRRSSWNPSSSMRCSIRLPTGASATKGLLAIAHSRSAIRRRSSSSCRRALALAYGRVLKGPLPAIYVPHWTAWGAAYGGVNTTFGNASVGSNQLNANTFGFAGGLDYHVSADTIVGFALGGGGTNWNLASLSGSGRSTALQAGVYGITRAGRCMARAAFGFSNNWFNTNRSALGDQLQANFGGQSYGGRLEGGYRLGGLLGRFLPGGLLPDVIPYAAAQAQDFQTPNYSENDLTGGGFDPLLRFKGRHRRAHRNRLAIRGRHHDRPTCRWCCAANLPGRMISSAIRG